MGNATASATTFLFTDIEGSTAKWERHPQAMPEALQRHDRILSEEIRGAAGRVFKTVGDAFCAAFDSTAAAVSAAEAIQRRLAAEDWGEPGDIIVRCAIHQGPALERDGDYFGPTVNRVARILSVGHGGQVLLSAASAESLPLARAGLFDLGEHRLKDLQAPERIFQLETAGRSRSFPPLRSLNRWRHNLPIQHTSFIGRTEEIARIKGLLSAHAIVTLRGFGGCGKTRLALHTAAELLDRFPDGIYFVELNALNSRQEILDKLRELLEVPVPEHAPPLPRIVRHLKDQTLLLLLDNCEHLIDDAADLVAAIAAQAPRVKLLATSREALRIDGERVIEVPPLSTGGPTDQGSETPEAVLLFLDRCQGPGRLVGADLTLIADVCRRLDGIPLAIELAAGLTASLPLPDLAGLLDSRFDLLRSGQRNAPPQHRTLKAAIDWSYDRLPEGEQRLLRLLATLKWEWTIASCADVAAGAGFDEHEAAHRHTGLVEKSLIVPKEAGRFHLLETVREYARERLTEAGEEPAAFQGLVRHHLALAENASGRLFGDHFAALADFRREYSNLLAVCDGLEARGGAEDCEALARLLLALYEYWQAAGLDQEADQRFRRALQFEQRLSAERLARLLVGRARNLNSLGLYQEAEAVSRRAFDLSAGRYPVSAAWAQLTLGVSLVLRGRLDQALEHYQAGRAIFEGTDDTLGLAGILGNIGGVLCDLGRPDEAESLLLRACELYRQAGDTRRLAYALSNLGSLDLGRNDLDGAERRFRAVIEHLERNGWLGFLDLGYTSLAKIATLRGDRPRALAHALAALRAVLRTQNLGVQATCLVDAAQALLRLGRRPEGLGLLGAAAAIERSLHDADPQRLQAEWLRGAGLDVDLDDELRGPFATGLALAPKDLPAALDRWGL